MDFIITPVKPTTVHTLSLIISICLNVLLTPVGIRIQVLPEFAVFNIVPFVPTARPINELKIQHHKDDHCIDYI